MIKGVQAKQNAFKSPLLNDFFASAWDIYDSITLLMLGIFLAFYFVFHGMHVNYIWGDFGRWHEEVRRFAQGEIPYKDFTWQYPPLALYLYGWVAKAFGDSFLTIRLIGITITILIAFMVFLIARHCVPKKVLPVIVMASMIMGIGSSNHGSESLVTGMYTPSVPLGILLSLVCLFASIKYIITSSNRWLYVMGVGFAGAFLTKQDFWIPVVVCGFLVSLYQWRQRSSVIGFGREVIHWILPALVVPIFGYLLVIMQTGLPVFMAGMGGFGIAQSSIGRLYPTWRKIFDQSFFLSAFAILGFILVYWSRVIPRKRTFPLLIIVCVVTLFFGGVRLGMTYWIGSRIAAGDTALIHTRTGGYFQTTMASTPVAIAILSIKHVILEALANVIPLFVAVGAAASFLFFFWKHRESSIVYMGVLLAVWVIAARMRRLFEHVDVLHLLVEPLFFVLVIQIACAYKNIDAKRCNRLIFGAVIVFVAIGLSLFTFYELRPRIRFTYEKVITKQGSVWIPTEQATEFRIVKRLITSNDPSGDSPLLPLPYQGALNYMLDKKNPTPMTQGFSMKVDQKAIRAIVEKDYPIIVFDRSLVGDSIPLAESFDLTVWEPQLPHSQEDEQFYENLVSSGYQCVERPPTDCSLPIFEVYVPLLKTKL